MSKVVWFDISGTSAMGVINGRAVTIEARRGGPHRNFAVLWSASYNGNPLQIPDMTGHTITQVVSKVEEIVVRLDSVVEPKPIDNRKVRPISWYQSEGTLHGSHPAGSFTVVPSTLGGKYPLHYIVNLNGRYLESVDTIDEAKETAFNEINSILRNSFE